MSSSSTGAYTNSDNKGEDNSLQEEDTIAVNSDNSTAITVESDSILRIGGLANNSQQISSTSPSTNTTDYNTNMEIETEPIDCFSVNASPPMEYKNGISTIVDTDSNYELDNSSLLAEMNINDPNVDLNDAQDKCKCTFLSIKLFILLEFFFCF